MIATVILAVEKNDLAAQLKVLQDESEATTTSSATTTTSSSSETTTETNPETTTAAQSLNYRLPNGIVPSHYDLFINPDLESGSYEGSVKITLSVSTPANQIRLHTNGLTINSISLHQDADVTTVPNDDWEIDTVLEQLIINLNTNLPVTDDAVLEIDFGGSMLNRLVGLYSSTYYEEIDGERVAK